MMYLHLVPIILYIGNNIIVIDLMRLWFFIMFIVTANKVFIKKNKYIMLYLYQTITIIARHNIYEYFVINIILYLFNIFYITPLIKSN